MLRFHFLIPSAISSGDWELEAGYEDTWSATRGYPKTGVFHEGRLYFGGSKSLPSALFGSKVGDFFNFLEAEGLDDDAIFAILSSNTVNSITGLRSGRDLQRSFLLVMNFLCNREKVLLLRQLI